MKKYIHKKTGKTITLNGIIINVVSYLIVETLLIVLVLDCINKI